MAYELDGNTFAWHGHSHEICSSPMVRRLTREQVQIGVTVRLIVDYLSVPAGTLGTVETINRPVAGQWHFTVRWKAHRPTAASWRSPQGHRMRPMECSLNLSEEDLHLFEIPADQDLLSPEHPGPEIPLPEGESSEDVHQLKIPFVED
jgi:hypothetical protein